jgi:hypothetical protein
MDRFTSAYEAFRMIITGKSLTEIAELLNLSVKTISTHKTRILEEMELPQWISFVDWIKGGYDALRVLQRPYPSSRRAGRPMPMREVTAVETSVDVRVGHRTRRRQPLTSSFSTRFAALSDCATTM